MEVYGSVIFLYKNNLLDVVVRVKSSIICIGVLVGPRLHWHYNTLEPLPAHSLSPRYAGEVYIKHLNRIQRVSIFPGGELRHFPGERSAVSEQRREAEEKYKC